EVKKKSIFSPNPVTKRIVNEKTPDSNEKTICFIRNAFSKGTGNKRWCYNGKFCLKHGEDIFRNSGLKNSFINTFQKDVLGIPSKPSAKNIASEGHAIAADHPKYGHDTHCCKAVHHGAEYIFCPD